MCNGFALRKTVNVNSNRGMRFLHFLRKMEKRFFYQFKFWFHPPLESGKFSSSKEGPDDPKMMKLKWPSGEISLEVKLALDSCSNSSDFILGSLDRFFFSGPLMESNEEKRKLLRLRNLKEVKASNRWIVHFIFFYLDKHTLLILFNDENEEKF